MSEQQQIQELKNRIFMIQSDAYVTLTKSLQEKDNAINNANELQNLLGQIATKIGLTQPTTFDDIIQSIDELVESKNSTKIKAVKSKSGK
jgi:hypothetical protein